MGPTSCNCYIVYQLSSTVIFSSFEGGFLQSPFLQTHGMYVLHGFSSFYLRFNPSLDEPIMTGRTKPKFRHNNRLDNNLKT